MTVAKVTAKMAKRAATLPRINPYANLTAAEFEPILFNIIEKELKTFCETEHQDALQNYAFVLGNPLNDTVFMCTHAEVNPDASQRSFDVEVSPDGVTTFVVDFYAYID